MSTGSNQLSLSQAVTLACVWEATAPKPGNVHRGADFEDLRFEDFLVSAIAIGPVIGDAAAIGVGRAILRAVQVTRQMVGTNTNLGTILLLAPLAAVPRNKSLVDGIGRVLDGLDGADATVVYEAIRTAQPGGMGQVDSMDVAAEAPADLLAAMRHASEWDLVARQYADRFAVVLREVAPWLVESVGQGWTLTDAIIHTQLRLISAYGDSLIARKCGIELARQASDRAAHVLSSGRPGQPDYLRELGEFDFWLRADGHRRNPGTTADLIAAGLFACLREGSIHPPRR
jgi:triphosphoribosyl-dephospho-CoA synthase